MGRQRGYKASKEERDKISAANKISHMGLRHSLETIRKISLSKMGIKRSPETIKKMVEGRKGYKHSDETRVKISESRRGLLSGDKHPLWKGGITPKNQKIRHSVELRLWRESVFARDNWTCQDCGRVGGKLNAHHIKPFSRFPELRTSIDNGITLCNECHRLRHSKKNT